MIFPCGLPDSGNKKNEKKFVITKIVLIFVVLFGFKGSFTLLWLPFSKRKIGCLNATHHHSNTRKYKTLLCSIPRMMSRGHHTGIIFFVE